MTEEHRDLAAALDEAGIEVISRFDGGEFGAQLVRDRDGRPWVLKSSVRADVVERLPFARRATTALRSGRYPAPAYGPEGSAGQRHWWLQQRLEGQVARPCPVEVSERMVALASAHVGLADGWLGVPANDVSVERIEAGLAGLLEINPIVDELLSASERLGDVELRTSDVVHGDFHPLNVLTANGRLTGVFDWDFAHAGDWRQDLVVLAFWADALVSVDGPGMRAAASVSAAALDEFVSPDVRARLVIALFAFELEYLAQAHPERIDWFVERMREVQGWWR